MTRVRTGVAVAACWALLLTSACGGSSKKKAAPSPSPASPSASATPSSTASPDATAQQVVDAIKMTAAVLPAGFVEEQVDGATSLDTPTFDFCKKTWAGDVDRQARVQTRFTQASQKRVIDQEIVFYKTNAAAASLKEFATAIQSCKGYKTDIDGKQATVQVQALGQIPAFGPDQASVGEVARLPDKSELLEFTIITRRGPHLLFINRGIAQAPSDALASKASVGAGEIAGYAAGLAMKRPLPPGAEA